MPKGALPPTAVGYYRLLGKALLATLVLRLAISVATLALGGNLSLPALFDKPYHDAPFFALNDLFADSLKSGMAQTAITAPLMHDPAVQNWHPLFRNFLLHNDYLGHGLTIRQTPPLANLQLMAVAWGVVHSSPEAVAAAQMALFLLLGWALARHPAFAARAGAAPWVWGIACLSYPALFMIDRGNFHSGFASLAVCAYLAGVFSGKARGIGLVVMAVAINYRPNLALLTLAECVVAPAMPAAVLRIAGVGALSLVLATAGYGVCHAIDPAYTMASFLNGLARYKTVMVVEGGGLDWNASLFGIFEQGLQLLPDSARPQTPEALLEVSGKLFIAATAACGAIGLAGVWAFATGRLRALEAAFLLLALNMLATPFFAEYHMLAYAAVLLLLPMAWPAAHLPVPPRRLINLCAVFALFSLLRYLLPITPVSLLVVMAVPCALWWMVQRGLASEQRETQILFVAAFWGLCSLGGITSQGPMEAVSVLIASGLLLAGVLRRAPGTVRAPLLALSRVPAS